MNKHNKTSALGFFKYFKGFIGNRMYIYLILNVLIGFFDGLGLAMFIPLISVATGSVDENSESLGKLKFLVDVIKNVGLEINLGTVLGMMILLFLIKGIFYYIKLNYLNKTLLIALKKIRFSLVNGLKHLSYEGFTKLDAGKIQNNMVGETGKLMGAMNSYFTTVQHVIMLITYVLMAFASNWKFALMVAIGGVITNFLYKYINQVTKKFASNLSLIGHDFNGNLIQSVQNFKYLKATNYFQKFENRLKDNIEKSESISYKMGKIGSIGESLREPMIIIIIAVVIYIQVSVFQNDFSSIMVSLLIFYRALTYLVSMQNSWNSFIRGSAGVDSVEKMIGEFQDLEEKNHTSTIDKIEDLHIKNISLTYDNKKILNDVSLDIPQKTSIALVGESGAGKTTLANVACGLLFPHEGKVFSAQQSVFDSDIDQFRNHVGYITQEAVIFDDTLYNNITFWADKTPENIDRFHEILKMVSLENFVNGLEKKEDTQLGNNGILISGGQKQRVSIARELYKDAQLLIMDEATSALDSETERHIKESIDLLHGKYTMIIIAHRLSTIKNVDKVCLMENGKIVDSGSYPELLQKSEKFRKMVELQNLH